MPQIGSIGRRLCGRLLGVDDSTASEAQISQLLQPSKILSRSEVLDRPCPIPPVPGVYAWYFDEPPPGVPLIGCHQGEAGVLLYVGISPKAPPAGGGGASRQSLRSRVKYHYRGNAEGSTLRLTLGALLSAKLGIQLRRVGSGQRLTFSNGEAILSEWMARHARVCWAATPAPWLLEAHLIKDLVLPLNLDQNKHSAFHGQLTRARADQRNAARALPILPR